MNRSQPLPILKKTDKNIPKNMNQSGHGTIINSNVSITSESYMLMQGVENLKEKNQKKGRNKMLCELDKLIEDHAKI